MFEFRKTPEAKELIALTRSNSGVNGPKLAEAHRRLGCLLGRQLELDPRETTVVAVLQSGAWFAWGLYEALNCRFAFWWPGVQPYVRPETPQVILADAVVNTGKTLLPVLDERTFAACCVAQEGAVSRFGERLLPVRISPNFFRGAAVSEQRGNVGPDTGMRLMNRL